MARGIAVPCRYGRGGAHAVVTADRGHIGGPTIPESAEQGSELEAGADASMLANRVRAAVTYYRAMTSRGFVRVPTFYGSLVMGNSARVRTSGVETTAEARLLATSRFIWDMGVMLSAHRDEIESTGVPDRLQDNQYIAPGNSIGEYFSVPYSYADANGDGLIAPNEVVILHGELVSQGSPYPDYEGALRTDVTFGGRVHLSAILDRRGGAKLFNRTARLRCPTLCEEQHDPTTSLEDQSRSVVAHQGVGIAYIDNADYTKLREVRVALTLPPSVARIARASSARITLSGRNVYTWTPYKGLDPEIVNASHDSIEASDNAYQPTLRSFTARLDLAW